MNHILLLTDFSKNSKNAIEYSLELLKGEPSTFYVLHVKSVTSFTSDDLVFASNQTIYQALIKKEKAKLTKLVSTLKKKYQNDVHKFEVIVDYDVFTDAINQAVISKKIDLVVMGTNGISETKEVIFGSNAINVIRKVNIPTLVVPDRYEYTPPKEILLTLDALDSLHGKSFKKLTEFIEKRKLYLHVLRINPLGNSSNVEVSDRDDLTTALKGKNFKYHIIRDIPMNLVVNTYLQTNSIDMMALIVQKETFFERFFIGSSTTQISKEAMVPLLIYHS